MEIFFDKINKYRNERGISVKGLCKLLDVSRTTLWKWEKGQLVPSEEAVNKIANVLNVSINDISDIPESVQVSSHSFSGVVDSWLGLTEINDHAHQKQVDLVLNTVQNLNSKLNQSVLIIKALLDSMETMFYIKDSRLKYITANTSFLRNVSYNIDNPVLGKDDYAFFSGIEADKNSKEDRKVFQTGQAILRDERLIPGCRKRKWGLVSKLPVFDSENKIVGVIGTFVDITERKKSEKTRILMEKCLDSTGQIISITDDVNKKFIYISKKSLESISGYLVSEIGNKDVFISQCCHPDDVHKHYFSVQSPKTQTFDWRMVCADGRIKWIRTTVSQIWDSISKIQYAIGTSADVTQEYEQEKILSYKFIKDELMSLSPTILWSLKFDKKSVLQFYNKQQIKDRLQDHENVLGKNGQYILLFDAVGNKAIYIGKKSLERISGYTFEENHNFSDLTPNSHTFHPDDMSKFYSMPEWPATHTFDWRMTCADGKIKQIRTTRSRITDKHSKLHYSFDICTDITELADKKSTALHNDLFKTTLDILCDEISEEIINFIYLSSEFELITGYEKSELINGTRTLQSILHPDSLTFYNKWLKSKKTYSNKRLKIVTPQNDSIEIITSILSKQSMKDEIIYYGKAITLSNK